MTEQKKKLTEGEALVVLVEAADALGWNVAIPSIEDDEEVPGLIMGKDGYVDWVTEKLGNEPIPASLRKKVPRPPDDGDPIN